MRHFLTKFLIFFLLFHATTAFYYFYVVKNSSGDIGELGQIPFGSQYDGLDVPSFIRTDIGGASVVDVVNPEALASYSVITIGDSFSQKCESGYQWKLSALLGDTIANFHTVQDNPFLTAVQIINSGYIDTTQTIIVESVERCLVYRLYMMDTLSLWTPLPAVSQGESGGGSKPTFLDRYLSWIRLSLDIDDPIYTFPLLRDCFDNPRCASTLYVYSGDSDGDFLYRRLTDENYEDAAVNVRRFLGYARSRGIRTYVLIATDKYDAYEPFIAVRHESNPTLNHFVGIDGVYDPKPDLQRAIAAGTLEVYRHNNTHWSVVGADLVAEKFAAYVKEK